MRYPGYIKVKDFIVLGVCLLIYAGLIVIMVTPEGQAWAKPVLDWLPFMNLVDGTLTDIHKLLGIAFEWIGLDLTPMQILSQTREISVTPVSLLLDMSKLLLSCTIQSLLFLVFSFLFLHAGDLSPAWIDFVESPLYIVNHFLLQGLTLLTGGLLGSFLVYWTGELLAGYEKKVQIIVSAVLFAVLYLLFSLYFTLKAKWADSRNLGILQGENVAGSIAAQSFSFGRSLVKTLMCNIIPELLTSYVTNIVIAFAFYLFLQYRLAWQSLVGLALLWVWGFISDEIVVLLATITRKMPLAVVGKYCPLSGLLWLPATASMMLFMAAGCVDTAADPGTLDFQQAMLHVPFASYWGKGLPPSLFLNSNFEGFIGDLVHLFLLCSLMALLQYWSSSYIATLFTQVIGRIMIVMGLMLVIAALSNLAGAVLVDLARSRISMMYVAGFLLAVVIALLIMLQPYVMLQGFATSVLLLVLFQFTAKYAMGMAQNVDQYMGIMMIAIGVNLLFSLLQNIASVIEKKARKAVSLATGGLL